MTSIGVMAQLQDAYVAQLRDDAGCAAIFGSGFDVYEDVPPDTSFPYITLGEDQKLPFLAECLNGSEIYITLHVWDRNGGWAAAKQGADAIEDCLHESELTLPDFIVATIERKGSRLMRDPDGITAHAVVTFRAFVNPRA